MTQQQRTARATAYIESLRKSWTYNRLTEKEKTYFENSFSHFSFKEAIKHAPKEKDIDYICMTIYNSFLEALGISENHADWREEQ